MRAHLLRITLLPVITAGLLVSGQEPVKPKLNPHIITATRQVTLFTDLERQMLQAVQKKNRPALEAMLSEEFAVEMPDGDPLAGDEWLDSIMAADFTLKTFVVRQMSAVDLGTAVLVKYDRVQEATFKGQPESGEYFVVDLWKKSGAVWKLANRYVSKVSSTPWMPDRDVKPTGKQ